MSVKVTTEMVARAWDATQVRAGDDVYGFLGTYGLSREVAAAACDLAWQPAARIASRIFSGEVDDVYAGASEHEMVMDLIGVSTPRNIGYGMQIAYERALAEPARPAQRQDDLAGQLDTVLELAEKNGCRDAADWIRRAVDA